MGAVERGAKQVGFPSQLHPLARAASRSSPEWETKQRTLRPPRHLHPFKIQNVRGPEEDASTHGSSHCLGEVVAGEGAAISLASY